MKQTVLEFIRRGLTACGLGPLVLAVLYLILHRTGTLETLTVEQVCLGIFSLTGLAFIAGGMNVLYQMERLPLMVAILIHGGVLYAGYLATYLLNGWLRGDRTHILVFTGIFILGYLAIWAVIYAVIRRNTARVNAMEAPPPLLSEFDLIVCNPPYIPTADLDGLDQSVKGYEPHMALDGGEDGLDFYRAIAQKWKIALNAGGRLIFEIGYDQAEQVEAILAANGYGDIQSTKDPGDHWRVVEGSIN